MKSKPVLIALIIGGALVAVAMFSISFHGLYLFAAGPMALGNPAQRSALPIGLDIGQLMAAGTAIFVSGRWPRAFAWGVTALAVGLSGAGNYWSAHVRDLDLAGALAPMIAPAFLALVAELLVFVWREMYPAVPAIAVKPVKPAKAPARAKTNGHVDKPAKARLLSAEGMTREAIAKELGVGVRSVYRWLSEGDIADQAAVTAS